MKEGKHYVAKKDSIRKRQKRNQVEGVSQKEAQEKLEEARVQLEKDQRMIKENHKRKDEAESIQRELEGRVEEEIHNKRKQEEKG